VRALIVGAGPAGLTLASYLCLQGRPPVVLVAPAEFFAPRHIDVLVSSAR
jgi:2-polyprenyl-6-methoxyphenol hydroxylase-like FAD-dependent oxidoreductase